MVAPLQHAPDERSDHSIEEARWRHYRTQPAAQPLTAAGAPQAAESSHVASDSLPARDDKLSSWVGSELAPADCAAQLDTIAEVTDEVTVNTAPSAQRAAPPTAPGQTPASARVMTPPAATAAPLSQSAFPASASQNSRIGELAATTQQPQDVSSIKQPADALPPQRVSQQSASAAPTSELSQPVLPPAAGHAMRSSDVVDDDVTLATAAAFAEMNDMFSSALSHGTPAQPPTPAALPLSPANPPSKACTRCAEPVRGDEENARPQGSVGRTCLAPRGTPPRRLQPARSAPAPLHRSSVVAGNAVMTLGGATAVTCDMQPAADSPGGGLATDDTRPVPIADYQVTQSTTAEEQGPAGMVCCGSLVAEDGSLGGAYCEPTVTLATREAFAALNGMFAAQLPHDRAARPAIPLVPRPSARQPPLGSLAGGGWSQGSPRGCGRSGPAPREATRALPVYEDTQFLLAPANSPAEGVRLPATAQDTTQPLFLDAAPPMERTASLSIYEDTQLLPRGPGLDRTATLAVYEDTALVPQSRADPAPRPSPALRAAANAAGSADATAPLQLYEDTQFLTRALPRCADGRVVTPFADAGADPVRTPATEVQQV